MELEELPLKDEQVLLTLNTLKGRKVTVYDHGALKMQGYLVARGQTYEEAVANAFNAKKSFVAVLIQKKKKKKKKKKIKKNKQIFKHTKPLLLLMWVRNVA
jgi:predicted RNase H-like HicB family nuclease